MPTFDNNGGGTVLKSNKLMKAKTKTKNGKMTVKVKGSPKAVRSTLASFTPVSGNMESGS